MLVVRKAFRRACKTNHAAGLFSGTKEERKEERVRRRQEVWNEVNKGYFADFHEFRKNGGKRYEAPSQLCTRAEAKPFPRVSASTLSGTKVEFPQQLCGHVSLVTVSLRAIGMNINELYRQPFVKAFGGHPMISVWEISLVEMLLYRMLSRWLEANLKKQLPTDRHCSFISCTSETARIKKELFTGNSITGHVYLVDKEGLIRWRAHAKPTDRELKIMLDCTQQLL